MSSIFFFLVMDMCVYTHVVFVFYLLGMSITLLPSILKVFDHCPPLTFLGRPKSDADQGQEFHPCQPAVPLTG